MKTHETGIALASGFESEGIDWHWMGPAGEIHVSANCAPVEISFELTCGPCSQYPRFPFDVKVYVGNRQSGTILFDRLEQTQIVNLCLEPASESVSIRLESTGIFEPTRYLNCSPRKYLSVRISNMRIKHAPNPSSHQTKTTLRVEAGPYSFEERDESVPLNLRGMSNLRKCPGCDGMSRNESTQTRLGALRPARNLGPEVYDLLLCPVCELIYQSPLPRKEVLDYLYCISSQFTGAEDYFGPRAESTLNFYRERSAALTQRLKSTTEPIRIFEIGGGLSWMSRAAKSVDSESITVAQDITSEVVEICRWVDHYLVGDLDERSNEIERFAPYQIISLTHVIEHLPHPVQTLKFCKRLLARDGIIFITAPHRPEGWNHSRDFAVWQKWDYNHVPAHLQYFNAKSMEHCARQANLAVVFFDSAAEGGQGLEAWLCHGGSNGDGHSGIVSKLQSIATIIKRQI